MGEQVVQRWAYMTGLVSGLFYEDRPARDAFERAERLNAAERAVREGLVPVPNAPIAVTWEPLSDVELVMMSTLARDLDGRVSEPGFEEATEEEIKAEEARRHAALVGSARMRVEFDVYTDPEEPGLVSIAKDTHAVLAAEGAQVLADKDNSVLLCGGALRRHKFTPRESAWLRDGAILGARCQDCGQRVTREELLRRQFLEDQHGTCPLCGDALEQPAGAGRLGASCPTCREAGRE